MSIVSFHNITLNLAGNRLLDQVDWKIEPHDRVALVGRNGAGKSTLLRLLQGELVPDSGQINRINGLRVAGLMQEVPLSANQENVYHFLVKSLGEVGEVLSQFHQLSTSNDLSALASCQQQMDNLHAWDLLPRVEMMASRLGVDTHADMSGLSGGMKRRALLAAALIASPDLLLLDEPTNHLDVNAIEWLEAYLKSYTGSVLLVTHDREFLSQVANRIVEIDRGKLYSYECNYETYLDRREAMRLSEQKQNELFDKRLAEEEAWIRTGIKARRTRNEGRVRALKAMREQYKARREQLGKMQSLTLDVSRSGQIVLEARHLNYQIAGKTLIKDFSLLLTRGDKIGIIGPNGCGKTTLIRMLLGELKPESGTLKLGTSLEVAYFDQLRRRLDEQQTVMANVAEGADYVTINGKQKHVASYLREFLFPPERFNQVVSTLSGGERNRLLLAKLFAKPVNLLVMDEPTNDLDIETLELLENMLMDYQGTLLLISHDRAFINQVVTSVLVYEEEGKFNEYVGGYDDYRAQKKQQREQSSLPKPAKRATNSTKLSFNEQRELSQLPQKIEVLEEKISALQLKMAAPDFYQQEAKMISQYNQQLLQDEEELAKLYARWEALEERG
ncbi:ATP-binding cassette domain-containing protein [Legionella micdadei]|uniref:ATP-binding protein Uup n=1 Tax=Legionella micdadei TaxID=451 RepID=A0A098GHD3_LEGMI|nr:ATP-binding cassette domain-containing protein [Legionella micdadei]ARG96727.1 ABC transporter ATP-binding protein [Legionella micdadei]KTD26392.1 ABC transporter ATP-binding protein [Legionella micdadei]NSL19032.1 ATP-binding cassette domain-containing protein [Legionella micdadei]CEG61893.1 ABC transporter ATP-binding protein uup-1 [Legionella micdadei]SCY66338.1 ATP-binding cassette, subfamily F, uup [Legionella micdadei]